MLDIAKVYTSNNYGDFKVVNYINQSNIVIEFIDTGYQRVVIAKSVRDGNVKDKLKPSLYGVGFLGDGAHKASIKCKETKAYRVWKGMLSRCYGEYASVKYPTYKNCTVASGWHNFQNFAGWYEANYVDGYHLDKDIKQRGVKSKVYSESTCVFLAPKDNISEANSVTRKLERAIKVLQCIVDNPEWNDHHYRAKKCIEDVSL